MLTSSRSVSGRTTPEEHPSGSRHVLKGISAQFFMFLFPCTCGKHIQSTKCLEDGCNPLISINCRFICCLTSPFPPASSTAAAAPAAGRGRCWRREVTKAGSPGSQTVLPSCQGTLPPAVGWKPSGFQPVLLGYHHQLGFSNICTTRGTRYFLLQIRTPSCS